MSKIDLRNGEDVNLIYNLRETFYFSFSVADQDGKTLMYNGKRMIISQ
jgi:hypothetical protein